MDIQTLLAESKARFSHNSAKDYLREKYSNKFYIADQGGLWKADAQTISVLSTFSSENIVLIDTQNNPVEVDREKLLLKLKSLYEQVMTDYHTEWKELENKR
jgi:DNA polymerase III delta subunit